ncbi:hypothetical protein RRG08_047546 [Elysia crispata]|uniref:Uncharacterized protein n=1 Tax=Elysia crispata TaxID=231223 RepID=A0AAE0YQF7_9GAST|nr:hypothetical protein RRG08_047546 [Elysia crispata]
MGGMDKRSRAAAVRAPPVVSMEARKALGIEACDFPGFSGLFGKSMLAEFKGGTCWWGPWGGGKLAGYLQHSTPQLDKQMRAPQKWWSRQTNRLEHFVQFWLTPAKSQSRQTNRLEHYVQFWLTPPKSQSRQTNRLVHFVQF